MPEPNDAMIIRIAEAVKDELNGATFSQPFTAQRLYCPQFDLTELSELTVSVVPKALLRQAASRLSRQCEMDIDVAVQQKVTVGEREQLDALMKLTEEVTDHLSRKPMADAIWVKAQQPVLYAPEHLSNQHVFTSVITLTYRALA